MTRAEKRAHLSDPQRRCLIAATIDRLIPFPRGFANSKMGPFYSLRTVHGLVARGTLRVVRPWGGGRVRMWVTARAAA